MASVRTFIAIPLTRPVLDYLEELQLMLSRGEGGAAGRWVRPEGIHLTLKFLGDVPSDKLSDVYRAVQQACDGRRPFEIEVGGLGCFPNARRPRVIWAGVHEESGQLADLQRAVEAALEPLGFPREGRAFTPHLTLARIKQRASAREIAALGQAVAASQEEERITMQATHVHVIKSDLRPEGAIYAVLLETRLGVQ
jgi:2'-5' RNA ligase